MTYRIYSESVAYTLQKLINKLKSFYRNKSTSSARISFCRQVSLILKHFLIPACNPDKKIKWPHQLKNHIYSKHRYQCCPAFVYYFNLLVSKFMQSRLKATSQCQVFIFGKLKISRHLFFDFCYSCHIQQLDTHLKLLFI